MSERRWRRRKSGPTPLWLEAKRKQQEREREREEVKYLVVPLVRKLSLHQGKDVLIAKKRCNREEENDEKQRGRKWWEIRVWFSFSSFPPPFSSYFFSFLFKTNYNHNSFSDETQKWIVMSLYVEDTPGFHFFFFLPFLLPSFFSSSIYGLVGSFRVPQTHSFRLLLFLWFSECQILPSLSFLLLSLSKRKIAERGRKGFASSTLLVISFPLLFWRLLLSFCCFGWHVTNLQKYSLYSALKMQGIERVSLIDTRSSRVWLE